MKLWVVLALCALPAVAHAELSEDQFEEMHKEYIRILRETNRAIDGLFLADGALPKDLPTAEAERRALINRRMFDERFNERMDFLLKKYGITLEEFKKAEKNRPKQRRDHA